MLEQEARALLSRLGRIKPFVLHETMVPAAQLSPSAQTAIEAFLMEGRRELRRRTRSYLEWLRGPGRHATPEEMQKRFTLVRLRFNDLLSQFDLFADAITQRSEHEMGVFLAGLDVASADALRLSGGYFEPPPVLCYLDRGPGAAIRRARTRLPGEKENPAAIVLVPRERMVGHGIGSSLVHECGHQVAALLDLVPSLRVALQQQQRSRPAEERPAWLMYERWISEIVADYWSISRVGLASTLGLIGVVSLPRWFVFRINTDDPHPTPWLRVMLSASIGRALYPHPQWDELADVWQQLYPLRGLDAPRRALVDAQLKLMPPFVSFFLAHRPATLRGRSLGEIGRLSDRAPAKLDQLQTRWGGDPRRMRAVSPMLVFAALGQARARGRLSPERESRILRELLVYWALRSSLNIPAVSYAGQRLPHKPKPAPKQPALAV